MASSKLEIQLDAQSDSLKVVLSGELDADNCSELGLQVEVQPGSDVAVDMAQLRFVDSSGISEILQLRERAVSGGGSLAVIAASPQVRKVIEITGLTELLGLTSD